MNLTEISLAIMTLMSMFATFALTFYVIKKTESMSSMSVTFEYPKELMDMTKELVQSTTKMFDEAVKAEYGHGKEEEFGDESILYEEDIVI